MAPGSTAGSARPGCPATSRRPAATENARPCALRVERPDQRRSAPRPGTRGGRPAQRLRRRGWHPLARSRALAPGRRGPGLPSGAAHQAHLPRGQPRQLPGRHQPEAARACRTGGPRRRRTRRLSAGMLSAAQQRIPGPQEGSGRAPRAGCAAVGAVQKINHPQSGQTRHRQLCQRGEAHRGHRGHPGPVSPSIAMGRVELDQHRQEGQRTAEAPPATGRWIGDQGEVGDRDEQGVPRRRPQPTREREGRLVQVPMGTLPGSVENERDHTGCGESAGPRRPCHGGGINANCSCGDHRMARATRPRGDP